MTEEEKKKKIRTRRGQRNCRRGNLSKEGIRILRRGEERCDDENEGGEGYEGGEMIFRRTGRK